MASHPHSHLTDIGEAVRLLDKELSMRSSKVEYPDVTEALNRINYRKIHAQSSHPSSPLSTMDGFAVQVPEGNFDFTTQILTTLGQMPGAPNTEPNLTAVYISTGGIVPSPYNAVVPIEECYSHNGNSINIPTLRSPNYEIGTNIRAIGSDIKKGEVLVEKNTVLGPVEISILAQQGLNRIYVFPHLSIYIVSTGDELYNDYSGWLSSYKINDSNGPFLKSSLLNDGFQNITHVKLKDSMQAVEDFIHKIPCSPTTVVISTGGASVGNKDYIRKYLEENFDIKISKLNLKPGKPTMFATFGNIRFFALPGNPASVFVTYHLLVRPYLRALRSHKPIFGFLPPPVEVLLTKEVEPDESRPEWVRCMIYTYHMNEWPYLNDSVFYFATPFERQQSSSLLGCRDANGLLYVHPLNEGKINQNHGHKTVKAYLIGEIYNYGNRYCHSYIIKSVTRSGLESLRDDQLCNTKLEVKHNVADVVVKSEEKSQNGGLDASHNKVIDNSTKNSHVETSTLMHTHSLADSNTHTLSDGHTSKLPDEHSHVLPDAHTHDLLDLCTQNSENIAPNKSAPEHTPNSTPEHTLNSPSNFTHHSNHAHTRNESSIGKTVQQGESVGLDRDVSSTHPSYDDCDLEDNVNRNHIPPSDGSTDHVPEKFECQQHSLLDTNRVDKHVHSHTPLGATTPHHLNSQNNTFPIPPIQTPVLGTSHTSTPLGNPGTPTYTYVQGTSKYHIEPQHTQTPFDQDPTNSLTHHDSTGAPSDINNLTEQDSNKCPLPTLPKLGTDMPHSKGTMSLDPSHAHTSKSPDPKEAMPVDTSHAHTSNSSDTKEAISVDTSHAHTTSLPHATTMVEPHGRHRPICNKAHILTISTSVCEMENDLSGAKADIILSQMYLNLGFSGSQIDRSIAKDDIFQIQGEILKLIISKTPLIVTTGGTGATSDDVTPEAILPLLNKRFGGLETLIYVEGFKSTLKASLSRVICGKIKDTIIICLPGSPSGVQEGLQAITPVIPHLLSLG